ncbi:hypothetical protein FOA52_013844 [Chlamydomonas sp. UWO 241]|nr:hypothetical protein FOA52_013844 [Chlamydomonas sp. UWO 241]
MSSDSEGLLDTDSEGRTALHRALISKKGAQTVLALLERCPDTAQVADRAGRLPLHAAACYNASLKVINALLLAHKDGAKEKQKGLLLVAHREGAAKLDKYHSLPLHFAARCRAPKEVVNTLLAAHPDGVRQKTKIGRLPLHFAAANKAPFEVVAVLLQSYPSGAKMLTGTQKLPLHLAAGNLAPFEVITALLKAHPAGAGALAGRAGNLPLHYAIANEATPEVAAALLVANPRDVSQALQAASTRGPEWRAAFADAVACAARGAPGVPAVPRAWHETAKVEAFAQEVAVIVKKDSSMATLADANGVTAMEVAVGGCRKAIREAIAFLGRYHLGAPVHVSATCTVRLARDLRARFETLQLPDEDRAGAVALKLMHDEEAFLSEVQTRAGHNLDGKYVVGILRVYIAPSANDSGGRRAAQVLLEKCQGQGKGHSVEGDVHVSFDAVKPYRLCIMMPRGDRSLLDALQHELFTGTDWGRIRRIGEDVIKALGHMHLEGLVHCDVKPLNVMRIGETWRLIDLDVARKVGQPFGSKAPSSGYCAPELAKALLAAYDGGGDGGSARAWGVLTGGALSSALSGALSRMCASIAFDLWSFGALLFYISAACQLLPTDFEDNLGVDELKALASWTLVQRGLATGHDTLVDLLTKLLEPEPAARLAHWAEWEGIEAVGVMEHDFFRSPNTDMRKLRQGIDSIYTVVMDANAKLDLVLQGMQAQTRMRSSILTGDREVPSLLCFVPAEADNRGWMNPSEWLHTAGLIVLKIASAAGRIAGFPIPDFAGGMDQVLADQFDAMEKRINATMGAIDDAISTGRMSDDVRAATAKQLRWSCKKVKALLLRSGHVNWENETTLRPVLSRDGSCEWVLPKHAAEFEARGRALLGAHSKQQQPDAMRHRSRRVDRRAEELAPVNACWTLVKMAAPHLGTDCWSNRCNDPLVHVHRQSDAVDTQAGCVFRRHVNVLVNFSSTSLLETIP